MLHIALTWTTLAYAGPPASSLARFGLDKTPDVYEGCNEAAVQGTETSSTYSLTLQCENSGLMFVHTVDLMGVFETGELAGMTAKVLQNAGFESRPTTWQIQERALTAIALEVEGSAAGLLVELDRDIAKIVLACTTPERGAAATQHCEKMLTPIVEHSLATPPAARIPNRMVELQLHDESSLTVHIDDHWTPVASTSVLSLAVQVEVQPPLVLAPDGVLAAAQATAACLVGTGITDEHITWQRSRMEAPSFVTAKGQLSTSAHACAAPLNGVDLLDALVRVTFQPEP